MQNLLPNQAMGIWGVLRHGTNLWWRTLKHILPLSLFSTLLGLTPHEAILFFHPTAAKLPQVMGALFLLSFLSLIIYSAIFIWLDQKVQEKTITYWDAIKIGFSRFGKIILLTLMVLVFFILAGIITFTPFYTINYFIKGSWLNIGLVIMVLSYIYLFVAISLAFPLVVLENTKPFAALKESYRLIKGNWILSAAVILAALLFSNGLEHIGGHFSPIWLKIITLTLVYSVYPSFYTSMILTLLYNLRLKSQAK